MRVVFAIAAVHAFLASVPPMFDPHGALEMFLVGGKAAITPELLVLYRMITVLVFGFFGIYAGFFYWYFGSKDSDYHVDKGTVLVTGVAKLIVFAVFVHAYMAGIVTTIATVIGAGDFILGLFYLKYVFSEPSSDGSKKRPAGRGRGN